MSSLLTGVHPAPNIQSAPDVYEIENLAADPDHRIESAMWSLAPWDDRIVLDLGAGTGFHIPRFHVNAAHVFAVEPDDDLRLRAMKRISTVGLTRASIMTGSAERLFMPDNTVDVLHARFAYFFGPGCETGLAEVARVIRPGGTAFIIDNDLRTGTFAAWLRRISGFMTDADLIESFWHEQGFQIVRIPSEWRFTSRTDLEAVVKLEFGEKLGSELLVSHTGLRVDYHYVLYWRTYS